MDPFASILVAITAVTICGICLFIFVCALQPKFFRKLHGKANRTSHEPDSNTASNEDERSMKNFDPDIEIQEATMENSLSPLDASNQRRKEYLKSLEQSLRTGRRINNDDDDGDNDDEDDNSHLTPTKYIHRFLNKYIRRTRRNSLETTDL